MLRKVFKELKFHYLYPEAYAAPALVVFIGFMFCALINGWIPGR